MPGLLRSGRYILRGDAYGQSYDFECLPILVTPMEARLRTVSEPAHDVEIRPRYVGEHLDDRATQFPDGLGTMCGMSFDGEYVALAMWIERVDGDVLIIPTEY